MISEGYVPYHYNYYRQCSTKRMCPLEMAGVCKLSNLTVFKYKIHIASLYPNCLFIRYTI